MKKVLLLLLSIVCAGTNAQTYTLDNSFGNNGVLKLDFYPHDSFYGSRQIGDYYYFNSGYEMTRINSDGSEVINFYTLGKTNNFKAIDNSLYMLGTYRVLNSDNYNAVITKTDLAGNPDLNFGIDGNKIIDFGGDESLYDIALTSDGSLLCSGKGRATDEIHQITFKINAATGAVIPNGESGNFREYHCTSSNACTLLTYGYLESYGNGYLLIGYMLGKLSLIKIDESGVVDTSFADNGYKIVSGLGETMDNFKMVGEKIYCTSQTGNWVQYHKMMCYNLATDQVEFNSDNGPDGVRSFLVCPEGIYTTAISNTIDSNGPATDKFILRRKNLEGANDPTFNSTGSFSYDSPTADLDYYQDEAQTILKLDDGSFFLGGYTRYHIGPGNFFGRTIIKIKPQVLAVNSQTKAAVSLFPNPFQDKLSVTSETDIKSIIIYDLSGRIILEPQFETAKQITVDLSAITQKGIYLIEWVTDEGSFTRKITKG